MPTGCSDCGRPATGVYDLAGRPKTRKELEDKLKENPSLATDYDRPLCNQCATNRGLIEDPATPPAKKPLTPAERLAELEGES